MDGTILFIRDGLNHSIPLFEERGYEMDYEKIPVSVHGGLTFGRILENENNNKSFDPGFWIGFDTAHSGDNLYKWPEYEVWDETVRLFSQCYLS